MKKFIVGIFKKHYLFFILIPIVIISQYYITKPNLLMGLRDIDEAYTVLFLSLREQYPNILELLIHSSNALGMAYYHQMLYPGILYLLFGDNIVNYHIVTLIFKILAVLSNYILFYVISSSPLVAFISTIIYAFSAVGFGNFDSVAQSSDYPAIILLSIFLSIYFYLVKKGRADFTKVIIALPILLLALVASTERTYPVVILILLIEIALIIKNRSKASLMLAAKRGGILLSPIFALVILHPIILIQFLKPSFTVLAQRISAGYQEELLIPFISFSTAFLPSKFWAWWAQIFPISLMIFIMLFSAFVLSRKPLRFIFITMSVWLLGIVLVYLLTNHTLPAPNYFINHAKTARAGFYILGLSIAFFVEWLKNKDKLYIGLFLGPFAAFVFIFNIWLGGDRRAYFIDAHRYLATAAVFSSLFIGNFIVLVYKKFYALFKPVALKPFSLIPFLLIIPYLIIGPKMAHQYLYEKLQMGLGRSDQIYMRQQFLSYYQNIDPKNRRLFYIDTYTDMKNHGFYGSTIYSAHTAWPIYWPHLKGWLPDQIPFIEREFDRIESSVVFKEGKAIGLMYDGTFYKPENFFAFQLIDRKVIDVTDQVRDALFVSRKKINFPTHSRH